MDVECRIMSHIGRSVEDGVMFPSSLLMLSIQFLDAWNLVLAAPFTTLQPPVNRDKEDKCRDTLRLGERKYILFLPQVVVSQLCLEILQYYTMILQRPRIIVGDAGFEPGTSAPEAWCQ